MSALVATVGAVNANSYVTVEEANAYFTDRLYTDNWSNAGASEKTKALLWATRVLDAQVKWHGDKATETQALQWPRVSVIDRSYTVTRVYIPHDTIPIFLKHAQCEVALQLLASDRTLDDDATGIQSFSAGGLTLNFDAKDRQDVLPRSAKDLIRDYGVFEGKSGAVPVLRA